MTHRAHFQDPKFLINRNPTVWLFSGMELTTQDIIPPDT